MEFHHCWFILALVALAVCHMKTTLSQVLGGGIKGWKEEGKKGKKEQG